MCGKRYRTFFCTAELQCSLLPSREKLISVTIAIRVLSN